MKSQRSTINPIRIRRQSCVLMCHHHSFVSHACRETTSQLDYQNSIVIPWKKTTLKYNTPFYMHNVNIFSKNVGEPKGMGSYRSCDCYWDCIQSKPTNRKTMTKFPNPKLPSCGHPWCRPTAFSLVVLTVLRPL